MIRLISSFLFRLFSLLVFFDLFLFVTLTGLCFAIVTFPFCYVFLLYLSLLCQSVFFWSKRYQRCCMENNKSKSFFLLLNGLSITRFTINSNITSLQTIQGAALLNFTDLLLSKNICFPVEQSRSKSFS